MAIESTTSITLKVTGQFNLDELIAELQGLPVLSGPLVGTVSVYRAADQRESDSVTFSFRPTPIVPQSPISYPPNSFNST